MFETTVHSPSTKCQARPHMSKLDSESQDRKRHQATEVILAVQRKKANNEWH